MWLQRYAQRSMRPTKKQSIGSWSSLSPCIISNGSLGAPESITRQPELKGRMFKMHAKQSGMQMPTPATMHGNHKWCSPLSPVIAPYGKLVSLHSMTGLHAPNNMMLTTHVQQDTRANRNTMHHRMETRFVSIKCRITSKA